MIRDIFSINLNASGGHESASEQPASKSGNTFVMD